MFGHHTLHSSLRTLPHLLNVVSVSWFRLALVPLDQEDFQLFNGAINSGLHKQIIQENFKVSICELKLRREWIMHHRRMG